MAYPVSVEMAPALVNRKRLTTLFRLILAIPHLILVGGVGSLVATQGDRNTSITSESGLLGVVAWFLAIVSWFTIVFAGVHIGNIRHLTIYYLRWRANALAYLALLQDAYPPFADAPYPVTTTVQEPAGRRNRLTVAFRLLLIIPHVIALFFVLLAWCLASVAGWFIILVTGTLPASLHAFGRGALQWRIRVEAYMLLLVDDYPPFALR